MGVFRRVGICVIFKVLNAIILCMPLYYDVARLILLRFQYMTGIFCHENSNTLHTDGMMCQQQIDRAYDMCDVSGDSIDQTIQPHISALELGMYF